MAKTMTSVDGDMLDAMVFRACGRTAGSLEIVLDANRHVASLPLTLPAGVVIIIPDAAMALPQRPVFKLWE